MGSEVRAARRLTAIQIYVSLLGTALCALVVVCVVWLDANELGRWLVFTLLFGVAEYVDIFFHHERGRQSLNPSETVLLPMLVVLSPSETTLAVVAAMLFIRAIHWREGVLRFVFNIAQYGLAAAAATLVASLGTGGDSFTANTAIAAVSGVIVFAAISHILTAGAIAISESTSMLVLLRDVTGTAGFFLVSNILLGVLVTGAYLAAPWTLAIFPAILFLLALASRALLADTRNRERAEHLHTAARALAVGLDVHAAVSGFVVAILDVISAAEIIVIARLGNRATAFRARRGETGPTVDEVRDSALFEALETIPVGSFLLLNAGTRADKDSLARLFDAHSLIAVPLEEKDSRVGALIAVDRVGADDFEPTDAMLLETLAHELVLSLASFRLFDQILSQRERFRQIFHGSQEGICLLDDSGRVQAWNPRLARMTGLEEVEVLGTKWSDRITLLGDDGRPLAGTEIGAVSPDATLELIPHQGTSIWVSIFPGPVSGGDGAGWVVLIRDVTAERSLEQAKMDFLSTVSHELRTPMTGLKGALEVLQTSASTLSSDKLERLIGMMSWGTKRLEGLVKNLLIVSEISAGDVPMRWEEVDLGTTAKHRVDEVLKSHPLVEVLTPPTEVIAYADVERLSQALDHVLDNARRFGGPHGRITVAISLSDGVANIRVSDEGPGIPVEDRARIFERFVRLGDVMTRTTQGAGVGLFIAQRSVEAMGGDIAVEEADHGTCFRIRLPLADHDRGGQVSTAERRLLR